jgi:hypothetical protein
MKTESTREHNPPDGVRMAAAHARGVLERVSGGVLQQLADGTWPQTPHSPGYADDVADIVNTMAEHVREARERIGGSGGADLSGTARAELLPLNRKERYYTGTVLPMVVASDGFAYVQRFLSLCGLPAVDVRPGLGGLQDFQFITEYGFAESVYTPEDRARWPEQVEADTPDVVLVGPDWLLAVEAKMFHNPTRRQLEHQMDRQGKLVALWQSRLQIPVDRTAHVLLLPSRLASRENVEAYPVVTWESLLEEFQGVGPRYWLRVLAEALARHEQLESPKLTFGKNAADQVTGVQILEAHATATATFDYVGRKNGLSGAEFATDIATGGWRTRKYEVRQGSLPGNPNWFSLKDFVAATATGPSWPQA